MILAPGELGKLATDLRDGKPSAWERVRLLVDGFAGGRRPPLCPADRESVVCDTMSALWTGLARLRDDQRLLGFLRTTVTRVANRTQHRSQRLVSLEGDPACRDEGVHHRLEAQELQNRLLSAVAGNDEILFRLIYVAGEEDKDAAVKLGVSPGKFRKRKHFLHKRLRDVVERYEAGRPPPIPPASRPT